VRIKVRFEFEYDAVEEHYPEDVRGDAQAMADLDFDVDAAALILANGEEGKMVAIEVKNA
jgi:hypothetical protein